MTIVNEYEVSSESAVRHWRIPFTRLENVTPVETEPAAVLSLLPGTQVCGTVLALDRTGQTGNNDTAIIDFTASMVYWQSIRNVLTYAANVEATWGALNIGDPVYYDRSATMPAGVYLSTSPLQNDGVTANPLFGYIVPRHDTDAALFPKGGATASTQVSAVMQRGAGA